MSLPVPEALARWNSLTTAEREVVLDQPALATPPGVERHLDDPPNQSDVTLGVAITCLILATAFASLRLYAKAFIVRSVAVEDVFGLIAFGMLIGLAWSIFLPVHLGGSYVHQWNITVRVFLPVLYPFFFSPLFYALGMLFAKTAVLREWLRVFLVRGQRNAFFWICWVVMIINAALYTATIFLVGLSCRPIRKFWEPWTAGDCLNHRKVDFSTACVNLALDVAILLAPQLVIWKLNMTIKNKVGVSLVFSLGLLTIAAATARVVTGRALVYTVDRTYDATPPTLCAMAELTGVIMIFCGPHIPKVFHGSLVISQVAVSLRSWARMATRNRSGGSGGSGESRRSAWNRATEPNVYRRMEDPSQIPLPRITALEPAKLPTSSPEGLTDTTPNVTSGQIVRTTTLITQDDSASAVSKDDQLLRQHPWMDANRDSNSAA
ncbi:hypothetical protein F4780DRAFT_748020 [Xylariomycetidae sp. FL0641]|nr:hypothetical protein F4780DRAFT_748020 [Xylariomycetidae sp. FL0641]